MTKGVRAGGCAIVQSPASQKLIDNANNGNINHVQEVGGKLIRITTDPSGPADYLSWHHTREFDNEWYRQRPVYAEKVGEVMSAFSSDSQMQKIPELTQEFLEHVLYDEEPLFISDEATIWDVSWTIHY